MYFLGLDLGQKRDYSAVVVVARVREMVMSDALYGDRAGFRVTVTV